MSRRLLLVLTLSTVALGAACSGNTDPQSAKAAVTLSSAQDVYPYTPSSGPVRAFLVVLRNETITPGIVTWRCDFGNEAQPSWLGYGARLQVRRGDGTWADSLLGPGCAEQGQPRKRTFLYPGESAMIIGLTQIYQGQFRVIAYYSKDLGDTPTDSIISNAITVR